jgi:hypothetical protein
MEVIYSSETSVLTTAKPSHIQEDAHAVKSPNLTRTYAVEMVSDIDNAQLNSEKHE